ncbi:type II toxin-antitoxin system HicB family antitoxin [Lactobacillus sp. ESL0731]|uniref:type II toxin-antitoxin system HicB family antitoxin n=1 Tax=unclassified Lactobacillus TaxID=2620435 RepID=UPI0023F6FB9F|nr:MULTISPECIES: type II toxin-antitoxin system HicB family antitoxin [unclassified Lactobacillus]WEV51071.1 type II toxin-antitoxin system HicB family antitoxin [Lactobacillus sp. ESL0700]WEV62201.1 type II toxin-antitoxin system HicB family antitoxin [Lactobacillus sp. ESL0731]
MSDKQSDLLYYPIVLHHEDEGGYSVEVYDNRHDYTQGEDVEECMYMARDLIQCVYSCHFDKNTASMTLEDVSPDGTKFEDIKVKDKDIKLMVVMSPKELKEDNDYYKQIKKSDLINE